LGGFIQRTRATTCLIAHIPAVCVIAREQRRSHRVRRLSGVHRSGIRLGTPEKNAVQGREREGLRDRGKYPEL